MDTIEATQCSEAFTTTYIIFYGFPKLILTDNQPQLVAKFFAARCKTMRLKHLTTTFYHPDTNSQTERYNGTLATRLHHSVAEHHSDWYDYIQALPFTLLQHASP